MIAWCDLDFWANLAAILTSVVATVAYARYLWVSCTKRWCLERYLKREKEIGANKANKGQRTVLHLVANLKMAEGDVLDAAFRSKRIRCVPSPDQNGRVALLLFEYAA